MKTCKECGVSEKDKKIHKTTYNDDFIHLCSKHYQVFRTKGRFKSISESKKERVCDICGIGNDSSPINTTRKFGGKMNLCIRHYDQMFKYGEVSNDNRNEFMIVDDNNAKMNVHHKDGYYSTYFSISHLDEVRQHKWWKSENGHGVYIVGSVNDNNESLHNFISKRLFGEYNMKTVTIDHIDIDPLNNIDSNLRLATKTVQTINQRVRKDNLVGIKGVGLHKASGKWRARIKYGEVSKSGLFDTIDEAVNARKEWEKEREGWC